VRRVLYQYGLPVYREKEILKIPVEVTPPLRAHNLTIYNAYRYLVNKFSLYLFVRGIGFLTNYEPETGYAFLHTLKPIEEHEMRKLYEEFTKEYLFPRLTKHLSPETIDLHKLLLIFYYSREEAGRKKFGATTIILPTSKNVIDTLASKKVSIAGKLPIEMKELKEKLLKGEARKKKYRILIIEKKGKSYFLTEEDILNCLLGNWDEVIKRLENEERVKVRKKECIYCSQEGLTYQVSGRLGLGRKRMPSSSKTDFSTINVCLKCLLVVAFYFLDLNIDPREISPNTLIFGRMNIFYTQPILLKRVNALLMKTPYKKRKTRLEEKIRSFISTLNEAKVILKIYEYNELFGDEKLNLKIEDLDESIIERVIILRSIFPESAFYNSDLLPKIVEAVIAKDEVEFHTLLTYLLRKASEMGVRYDMSYVSKYIKSALYRVQTTEKIAYSLAKIASTIVHYINEALKNVEESDRTYVKRTFAETLRRAGLVTAIDYALGRIKSSISVIAVPIQSGEERDALRIFINELGLEKEKHYKEENNTIRFYVSAIPLIDIKVKEKYTPLIYERVYNYLCLERQELLVKSYGKTSGGGGNVAEGEVG